MRTSIELPEHLFRRAKWVALQRNITLKILITNALERELEIAPPRSKRMDVPPVGVPGGHTVPVLTNAQMSELFTNEELAKKR